MSLFGVIFVGIVLFSIGVVGTISRRNIFVIYMSLELMLNAINLMFISASRYFHSMDGQVISMIIIAISAAEAALFLSLVVLLYKRKGSLDADIFNKLSQHRDKS
jgi:NADH-quinone oxidoreductase subunit K